jgi:hypothetical protein
MAGLRLRMCSVEVQFVGIYIAGSGLTELLGRSEAFVGSGCWQDGLLLEQATFGGGEPYWYHADTVKEGEEGK